MTLIDPKTQILVQLEQHQIQIYNFPESELEPEVGYMNNNNNDDLSLNHVVMA